MKLINTLLDNIYVTSPYGDRIHPVTGIKTFHNGVDLRAAENAAVFAPFDGVIAGKVENSTGGKQLVIKSKDGVIPEYRITFSHLNNFDIESVKNNFGKGQIICYTGNTGRSTAPHLHVTIRKDGELVDPQTVYI